MQIILKRIVTDIVNIEMVTNDGGHPSTISRFHNIKICCILVRYKDYVDICSKDMPTLAPHLSRHTKGI
jgi:hypothetical protein